MNALSEVAKIFTRIGFTAYGGPAAHIAMLEDELVKKRSWVSHQHFLDLIGATSLIPGPNSTEMVMHLGHERAGWKGLFVAGVCFIVPAVLSTLLLAWFYTDYGSTPALEPFFQGIKPAVLVIIFSATYRLGKKAIKSWELAFLGALVVAFSFAVQGYTTTILLAASIFGMLFLKLRTSSGLKCVNFFLLLLPFSVTGFTTYQAPSLLRLGLFFLKVGAVLYGSGYVLISFLETELVHELQWLTESQLLDAIAIGQFTPGPVLSTATFIGYLVAGLPGAVIATVGIFLPSFFFVLLLNPLVPKLRKSAWAAAFLDSVNVAALGLMLVVSLKLAVLSVVTWQALVILLIASFLHFKLKCNSAIIVFSGAILGYGLSFIPL